MKKLKRVLIVEDDDNDQYLIKNSFSENFPDTELVVEDSCLKAINRLGLENFDFVLVDFRLGIIDIHPLVIDLSSSEIPFAIFSGSQEEEIRDSLSEIGDKVVIWNKKNIETIHTLIENHLGLQG